MSAVSTLRLRRSRGAALGRAGYRSILVKDHQGGLPCQWSAAEVRCEESRMCRPLAVVIHWPPGESVQGIGGPRRGRATTDPRAARRLLFGSGSGMARALGEGRMGGLTGTTLAMLQFAAIEGVGPSLTGAGSLHHRRVGGRIPGRPARRIRGRIRRRPHWAAGGHRDRPAHQQPRPGAACSLAGAASRRRHRRPGSVAGGLKAARADTATLTGPALSLAQDRQDLLGRRAG